MEKQITPSDLKIGNWLNYSTEEGILPTKIDWQDLAHLSEKPKDFNKYYSGIEITPEILVKCGFVKDEDEDKYILTFIKGVEYIYKMENKCFYEYRFAFGEDFNLREIEYLHELQNLFYCLTGKELKIEL